MSEQNSACGAMTFFRLARVDKNQNLTTKNDNVYVKYVLSCKVFYCEQFNWVQFDNSTTPT